MSARPRPATTGPDAMRTMLFRANQQGRSAGSSLPSQAEPADDSAATPGEAVTATATQAPASAVPAQDAPAPTPVDPAPTGESPQEAAALPVTKSAPAKRPRRTPAVTPTKALEADDSHAGAAAVEEEDAPSEAELEVGGAPAPASGPADSGDSTASATAAAPGKAATRRKKAPARPLATPFAQDVDLVKKSFNLAPATLDAMETWLRERRSTMRRPSLSWLIDAALNDLPTDVDELRALAAALPAEVYSGGPSQVGVRVQRSTAERVEDAQFELSTIRTRAVPLWHCLSGALMRQLESEGITAAPSGDSTS